jgi:hypothetical protein
VGFGEFAERGDQSAAIPGAGRQDDVAGLDAFQGHRGDVGAQAITQKLLDWHPDGPGLIEDLDEAHYFEG